MTREDWIALAQERAAVMEFDAGIPAPLAKEKAQADTIKRFGRCPAERKTS